RKLGCVRTAAVGFVSGQTGQLRAASVSNAVLGRGCGTLPDSVAPITGVVQTRTSWHGGGSRAGFAHSEPGSNPIPAAPRPELGRVAPLARPAGHPRRKHLAAGP